MSHGLSQTLDRPTKTSPVTLTVVDDEPLIQDVLSRAARSWNYECQTAGSAEQALELLERHPTPIVITDLRMPGRGGVWLVREVHRRWPDAAIIVITAGHDTDAAIDCLNAGALHYFLKPVKLEEFHHVLETAAQTYRLRQENARYRLYLERTVARQTHKIRLTYLSAIDSLVRAMEERDPYTAGHSFRVRRYALRLAQALGVQAKLRRKLSLAAKLHDIGKIGVPEAILNKEGPLTAAEHHAVQQHPVIGERVLAPVIRDRVVLSAIRGHHERLDGSGYPDGLCGKEIPLLARLITIADCFDALTSSRAYRAPLPLADATDVLRQGRGSHFEPHFLDVFLDLVPTFQFDGV